MAAPPPEVYVTQVTQRDVPVYMELVGQTRGFQDVDIRARVEGYLDSMNFREGSFVKKGDLLYQIDPKPFEAQVAASKANLVTAQARLTKMQTDVDRLTPLAKIQAVSQKELDDAVANRDAAKAQVDAEKAKLDQAQLDLGYTQVTAPLDGLIGTTNVKVGNLVGRGENTLLDTISVIDPILFRCGLSEAEYLDLARRAEELKKQLAGKPVEVQLILADGTIHPNTGRLDAIERAVDPTTGTLSVQFSFPNPDKLIRPGQYGRARFITQFQQNAILVPQKSVQELQNLYSLAVVGSDNKVTFRNVKVGPREGDLWVINEGLKPGETVIVEGLQRVKEGMTVSPKPVTEGGK
ncbi:MAG TPA: efflux RND transporter periplasmic adaptor subunit [Acidobacteriota bacterium]|nr:efflux RND transporter periplasmic adaptor subunit [Acidobacteriota bacterium]